MKDNDYVLTAEEVSGLLKVSLVTVRRWTSSGYLPHMHFGLRMVRYRQGHDREMDGQKGARRPGEPGSGSDAARFIT